METIKGNPIIRCVTCETDELEAILEELFHTSILVHYDMDGTWFDTTISEETIFKKLSEYFESTISYIHTDQTFPCLVWIALED